MSVLITMPTYQTPPELLDRAVRSVLDQTHRDLKLVLMADGHRLMASRLPQDDRLIVHRVMPTIVRGQRPASHGRYFLDAVTTSLARDDEVVIIHDADDWSEPDRLERLLPVMRDGAAIARYWRHQKKRAFVQEPARHRFQTPTEHFTHIGHWCSGAYTGERIRRAGGIHPGFRVGYDTLFVRMIALTGKVGISQHAAYHWEQRDGGSLTTSKETGFRSAHREAAKKQLIRLNLEAWHRRHDDPGAVIREDVPADLAEQVAAEAELLRPKLGA